MAKRRYVSFRYGVRSLFVAMTCLAIVGAYFGARIREGVRHEQIAERINLAGGGVMWSHYERVPAGPPGAFRHQSTLPAWMERARLSTAFRRITFASLRGYKASDYDAQLAALAELGAVATIDIYGAGFGMPEFHRLMSTVEIETLSISSPNAIASAPLVGHARMGLVGMVGPPQIGFDEHNSRKPRVTRPSSLTRPATERC